MATEGKTNITTTTLLQHSLLWLRLVLGGSLFFSKLGASAFFW
jgi:hypothetical protein